MHRVYRQSIPKWKRLEIYETYAGKCMYCGEELHDYYEIEHIHPVISGGGNGYENLGLSCARCNSLKGTKTIEEFRESLIDDVICKKNKVFYKYYCRGLEKYLTESQVSEIHERLVELDMYMAYDLDLKFYFERE